MNQVYNSHLKKCVYLLITNLFFLGISFSRVGATDWRSAYTEWQNTYEAAQEILKLAEMAELLGNDDVAESHRNNALGNLEEDALKFLRAEIPADKCNDYADALFKIGAVVAELLPKDDEKLFRYRVIMLLSDCPYFDSEELEIPAYPWESKWAIEVKFREESVPGSSGGFHNWIDLKGTFVLPALKPHLINLLGTKNELEKQIQEMGREITYAMFKANAIMENVNLLIESELTGNYKYARDPSEYHGDRGRWRFHHTCPACPLQSIPTKYKLVLQLEIDEPKFHMDVDIVNPLGSLPDSVHGRCIRQAIDTRDGSVSTESSPNKCNYTPRRGFSSSYWNQKTLPLRNGIYIVDKYDGPTFAREITITLTCMAMCSP